jgi:hypothetical protein
LIVIGGSPCSSVSLPLSFLSLGGLFGGAVAETAAIGIATAADAIAR